MNEEKTSPFSRNLSLHFNGLGSLAWFYVTTNSQANYI